MKNLILCLYIIISTISVYSQDKIDPPKLPNFNTIDATVYDKNFSDTSFIRGWNWGGPGRHLDEALFTNYYHNYYYYNVPWFNQFAFTDSSLYNRNHRKIVCLSGVMGGRNASRVFNAHSLCLEPTILVDSTTNFQPRLGDKNGSVFGFYNRNFTVGETVSSGNDFDRFILHKDSLLYGPVIVLGNIWNGTILRWLDYKGLTNHPIENSDTDRVKFHPFNGKQWYITINLRALNRDSVNHHLTDTILTIKVPYILMDSNSIVVGSGFVKLDSIPDTSFSLNTSINGSINNDYRGKYRKLKEAPNQPGIFTITGNMLQNANVNLGGNSITLSAFATFDGRFDSVSMQYFNNPRFKNDWYENQYHINEFISKIDVEVKYYGSLDVALDYIRIETPRARAINFGFFDDSVRKVINGMEGLVRNNNNGVRVHSFYADDELIPSQWGPNRYFNMLVDTMAGLETATYNPAHQGNPPLHYLHATGFKEYWNGSNIGF